VYESLLGISPAGLPTAVKSGPPLLFQIVLMIGFSGGAVHASALCAVSTETRLERKRPSARRQILRLNRSTDFDLTRDI